MMDAGSAEAVTAFDASFLDIYTGGDKEIRNQVLVLFLTQGELLLGRLREALGEERAWHDAAHSLKGCAAGVGAGGLASIAREAERQSAAPAPDQAAILDELGSAFSATASKVRALLAD